MTERKLRVFLCYSSNDKPAVRELYQRLKAAPYGDDKGWIDPWLDEEKLYPGQDWDLEIEKAVEAADAVIVFLSNNSVTKEGYIQRELRFVLRIADFKPEGTVFVIPVRLEDCPMPRRLSMWQYVDYFPEDRKDWAYERLLGSFKVRVSEIGIVIQRNQVPKTRENSKNEPKSFVKEFTPDGHKIYVFGDIDFVKVPAGSFLMGSRENFEDANNTEKPQHTVDVPYDFWIARFPITKAQYTSRFSKKNEDLSKFRGNYPVVNVSLSNANSYLRWLNRKYKRNLLDGYVFRLPTEAEWEKAAKGQKSRLYPWGDVFDVNKCNTKESGNGKITPVGFYSPEGDSPYGVSDMAGNILEWTQSLMRSYPYDPRDGRDDLKKPGLRVVRGGSFQNNKSDARCSYRRTSINRGLEYKGFRIVVAPNFS